MTIISINNPRGLRLIVVLKNQDIFLSWICFIPAEGTLFLAIHERRQYEERR